MSKSKLSGDPKLIAEYKEYMRDIGSKGGKKSKRILTSEQARRMVHIRELKKKGYYQQELFTINEP